MIQFMISDSIVRCSISPYHPSENVPDNVQLTWSRCYHLHPVSATVPRVLRVAPRCTATQERPGADLARARPDAAVPTLRARGRDQEDSAADM